MKHRQEHIAVYMVVVFALALCISGCFGSGGDAETGDGDFDDYESEGEPAADGDSDAGEVESEIEASGEDSESSEEEAVPDKFRVVFLADTHIIDEFYEGPESNELDTRTMFETYDNLIYMRDYINALEPSIDSVYIAGDVVHNYPSEDWDFYFENTTRFDIAADILKGFEMPVYIVLGNHDYDIGRIPVDFTHELFRQKFGLEETYYEVERYGFKFLMLDNFLGATNDPEGPDYSGELGSLGEAQLEWLDEKLSEGKPSFVMNHNPLLVMKPDEGQGRGLKSIIAAHPDTVMLSLSGHTHIWMNWTEIYGLPHVVLGSTRYDRDNCMIVEIDTVAQSFAIVNESVLAWGTRNAEPWTEE